MPITSTSQQYSTPVSHVLLHLFETHVNFVLEFIIVLLSNIVLVRVSNWHSLVSSFTLVFDAARTNANADSCSEMWLAYCKYYVHVWVLVYEFKC